jgi:hypothetical protein
LLPLRRHRLPPVRLLLLRHPRLLQVLLALAAGAAGLEPTGMACRRMHCLSDYSIFISV